MREWPKELNAVTVFVGRQMEGIFFSENTASLHFDGKLSVTIMSDYIYIFGGIAEEVSFPIHSTKLISSIGSKVTEVELQHNKDLCLWFQDGAKLEMNGSTPMYECYSVNFNGREFYV